MRLGIFQEFLKTFFLSRLFEECSDIGIGNCCASRISALRLRVTLRDYQSAHQFHLVSDFGFIRDAF